MFLFVIIVLYLVLFVIISFCLVSYLFPFPFLSFSFPFNSFFNIELVFFNIFSIVSIPLKYYNGVGKNHLIYILFKLLLYCKIF